MDKRDFDYILPEELIAQAPLAQRRASRLLQIQRNSGTCHDRQVEELPSLLTPGDLLVFNDTRVLAARMHGRKATGGAIEIMLERIVDSRRLTAKIRANNPPRSGTRLCIGEHALRVETRSGELYSLALDEPATTVHQLLAGHGHMPLPPYIQRPDEAQDRQRYQTVWARHDGAVAAPTAGLHFDQPLLNELQAHGINFGTVTLHVGSGTYQRLREGELSRQTLHAERVHVDQTLCEAVAAARAAGGRVIAVGTTAVRSLEAAARANAGQLAPWAGETQLFLKPGDEFQVVDGLFTNFHEPQSSLMMLVCAFAGRQTVISAYQHAIAERYRFLSYGDATLML